MNTVKFADETLHTTEQHDLRRHETAPYEFFGQRMTLRIPCNVNLFVTNRCNARCRFCIAGDERHDRIGHDDYIRTLTKLLDVLDPSLFEITITGGEPTVAPSRLVDTMRACHERSLPVRTFSTNGQNLLAEHEGKPICQHLVENGVTHNISVSRMATGQDENEAIMGARLISDQDIERLAMFFGMSDADMRVSCNLIDGHVDSLDKMIRLVKHYRKLGVPTVMFRELIGASGPRLDRVFTPDGAFEATASMHGDGYDVDVYRYDGMVVKRYMTAYSQMPRNEVASLALRDGVLMQDFKTTLVDLRSVL